MNIWNKHGYLYVDFSGYSQFSMVNSNLKSLGKGIVFSSNRWLENQNSSACERREQDTRLWRIFHHYVDQAIDQADVTEVKRIGIDETHRYMSLFVDVDCKMVLFAMVGKGKDKLERFREHLMNKGIPAKKIEEVCYDMSAAFIKGVLVP